MVLNALPLAYYFACWVVFALLLLGLPFLALLVGITQGFELMSKRKSDAQCITYARADAVQQHAKNAALEAVKTGKTQGLTALGRAYYEKLKKQR